MAPWVMDNTLQLRITHILLTLLHTGPHLLPSRNKLVVQISRASSLIASPCLLSFPILHTILPTPMFPFPRSFINSKPAGESVSAV